MVVDVVREEDIGVLLEDIFDEMKEISGYEVTLPNMR
jgi:predicted RNA-binding protein